jgi:glycosyltransferase involved in cell wall biosynthesis
MKPLISVVVPLYNKERYIRRTIASVLGQSCGDFELLVVDDGSTDGGPALVEAMGERRLRLLRQPNAGVSAARNRGIREARGEIVAFLDADDEWEPDFLAAIARLAEGYPQAGLFATGYRKRYRNFSIETAVKSPSATADSFLLERYFLLASRYLFVTSSNVAIRKEVFATLGGFAEGARSGEDRDMWARAALAYPLAYSPEILATYHCAAQDRSCLTGAMHLIVPPDILHLQACIEKGTVFGRLRQDVRLYLNDRILQLISENLIAGNLVQARKVFEMEKRWLLSGRKIFWYAIALKAIPVRLSRAVEMIRYSRHIFRLQMRISRKYFTHNYQEHVITPPMAACL